MSHKRDSYGLRIEKEAHDLGNDPGKLRKLLLEERKFLSTNIKKYFRKFKFSASEKRLYGDCGLYLQWQLRRNPKEPESYANQQTSIGKIYLRNQKEDSHGNHS